jgi:hypothetical protein
MRFTTRFLPWNAAGYALFALAPLAAYSQNALPAWTALSVSRITAGS